MKNKIIGLSFLPIVVALVFLSFSTKDSNSIPPEYLTNSISSLYEVPSREEVEPLKEIIAVTPVLTKNFLAFKEAVGFKESGGRYNAINEFGFLGKYQFGKGTLEMLGVYNLQEFIQNPKLQEATFYTNASRNKWILQRDIKRFEGKVIDGVKITESGILAAAHLSGPGNVKKFLRSGGAIKFSDAFGTSMKYYLKRFSGYDTSFIKPEKNPRVDVAQFKSPSEG